MFHTTCDGCGITLNDARSAKPSIYYFTNYDFCPSCFGKLEDQWEDAFQRCGHDMAAYLKEQVTVANGFVKKAGKRR